MLDMLIQSLPCTIKCAFLGKVVCSRYRQNCPTQVRCPNKSCLYASAIAGMCAQISAGWTPQAATVATSAPMLAPENLTFRKPSFPSLSNNPQYTPKWYHVRNPPPHMATDASPSPILCANFGFHNGRRAISQNNIQNTNQHPSAMFTGTLNTTRHAVSTTLCAFGRTCGLRHGKSTACRARLTRYKHVRNETSSGRWPSKAQALALARSDMPQARSS
mmetsp:Transcript_10919/g.36047  ORF Transcript_10919/g.36047 Transcript_10919/m.36047 type:complete len:218 (-) Transcript_10919:43-696(-)